MMNVVPVLLRRPAVAVLALLPVIALVIAGCTGGSPARTFNSNTLNVLTCRDSPGQQGLGAAPARLVNGVDGFIGDANAYDNVPSQVIAGQRYLAWKTALSVAPGARPYRTVSIARPASARLGYAIGDNRPPPSRRVRMPACGRRYTLYVGGIFVRHPGCVTLAVTGPGSATETVTVPILVAKC